MFVRPIFVIVCFIWPKWFYICLLCGVCTLRECRCSFSNIATPITYTLLVPDRAVARKQSCGQQKSLIKVIPPALPAAAHALCISQNAAHLPSPGALSYSSPGAGGRAIKFAQLSADTLPAEEKQAKVSIEPERRPSGRAGVADYTMTTLYYSTPGE